jgi:hypothetical protein
MFLEWPLKQIWIAQLILTIILLFLTWASHRRCKLANVFALERLSCWYC